MPPAADPRHGGWQENFVLWLWLSDVLVLTALYVTTTWVRFPDEMAARLYPEALLTIGLVSMFFLYLVGGYSRETNFVGLRYAAEHLIAFAFTFVVGPLFVYSLSAYTQTVKPGRLTVGLSLFGLMWASLAIRRAMGFARWRYVQERVFCFLGDGLLAQQLYRRMQRLRWPYRLVFHAVEPSRAGTNLIPGDANSPILVPGGIAEIEQYGKRLDSVVIAEEAQRLPPTLTEDLVRLHYRRVQVHSLNSFCATSLKLVPLGEVSPSWVFDADLRLRESAMFGRVKRVSDLFIAGFGLICALPLVPFIALAIRGESKGPVFFRQQRVGRFGESFTMFKFRTMRKGAETGDPYTHEGDERITKVGAFLRRHRIDELPQLWNVICGEMSLIGPRAEWTLLAEAYEKAIPYYAIRHVVRPGVTGWAQVNYPYGGSLADAREKLSYDLYYVRHYSLLLDLSIVLKTVFTVLRPLWGEQAGSVVDPVPQPSTPETQPGGTPPETSQR